MAPTPPRPTPVGPSAMKMTTANSASAWGTATKLPPTGPKAMRPFNPPSGPSALLQQQQQREQQQQKQQHPTKVDKVSIAFPPSLKPIPSGPSRLTSRPVNLDTRPTPSSPSLVNGSSRTHSGNGMTRVTPSSTHAESSRQALSRPLPPHLGNTTPSTNGHSPSTTPSSYRAKLPDPTPSARQSSPGRKRSKSPVKHSHRQQDEEDGSYRANFLPTTEAPRAKISFALPSVMANGVTRPKPPHLDRIPFDQPTPPSSMRPATPPPPDDSLPPPPPSPPARSPSPLPPPPSSEPASAPLSPYPFAPSHSNSSRAVSITRDSRPPSPPREPSVPPPPPPPRPPPSGNLNGSLAPPSFHFRELPLRRPTPSDDDDDETDAGSPRAALGESASAPASPPPPPPLEEAFPTPPPPPPPYVAPSYVPPACAFPRPGLGNYTSHKGKDREWVKRYDGMEGDVPVDLVDPRLALPQDQLVKGRGSMKHRTGFFDLDYEWDEYSTRPKPPPPPTAVLITGLSPLTTTDQISKYLRPYGRIKDIDAKMDNKSGMQLGICWINFNGPPHGRPGTAHDVANQVVRVCEGQRISLTGDEKIKVVLDGRGLRAQKAVKEEMDRRYAPKPKPKLTSTPISTPARAPAVSASTFSSAGAQTPRTELNSAKTPISRSLPALPRSLGGPYASNRAFRAPVPLNPSALRNSTLDRSLPSRPVISLPARPTGLPIRPDTAVQHLSSSFTAAPFSHHVHRDDRGRDHDRDIRRTDISDSYRPVRTRSRSRSVSSYSSYSDYTSDSDDARPTYRTRTKSPVGNRRRPGHRLLAAPSKEDEKAVERVKEALSENGHAHVFIDAKSLPANMVNEPHLRDHFKAFKPASILYNHVGWYILFTEDGAAYRAQRVLDKTAVQGHRIGLIVKAPPSTTSKNLDDNAVPLAMNEASVEKGTWRFLTITKKNRPVPAPRQPSPRAITKGRRVSFSSAESSEDEAAPAPVRPLRKRLPSFSSASSLSDEERLSVPSRSTGPTDTMDVDDDEPLTPLPPAHESTPIIVEEGEQETNAVKDVGKGKKRSVKAKGGKQAKKARLASPVVELPPPVEPEVAEIKLDEEPEVPKKPAKAKSVIAKPKKPKGPRTEVDKFLTAAEVGDEEDAYWLGQALCAAKDGIEPTFSDDEEVEIDDAHPLYHQSGAWRAEGWKKIPQVQKSTYLPQRNRAAVSVEEASGVTTGRTARLAGRDQHRQTAAVATSNAADLFAFNQLRIRKKQLRFARSAIEGYGLYAMETIHIGEMVCEYVGELCRAAVADVREQRYLKQGIGSSYLFRIDNDIVCDATFKGSVSRLINHSCDPSAGAKIIKVNGQSKIVIYAEKTLHPGEEILYDYKFPLESDPALRVPCLCGAATCRGWLN